MNTSVHELPARIEMNDRVRHQRAILESLHGPLAPGTRVLDFGCGDGNSVRAWRDQGFDARGCDVALHDDAASRQMQDAGLLLPISLDPSGNSGAYRLPFADQSFDVVVSDEVFEHVQNYAAAISEVHRVLRPGGCSLHLFPTRWAPIEPHVHVPLGGVFRSRPWLLLWALLGVRNPFQKGRPAREVVAANFSYLRAHTNYLSTAQIRAQFERCFGDVRFVEHVFLQHSVSAKGRALNRLVTLLPPLRVAYSNCWHRVLAARRAP
jgi:SAM-dependent methyltransferase